MTKFAGGQEFASIDRLHRIPVETERVFAIGDVHGRADLLRVLLAHIQEIAEDGRPTAVVFLGDLVDRGPNSSRVLDLVLRTFDALPASVLCLGNHDDWFRRFLLGDPAMAEDLEIWLAQGGEETLASYDTGSLSLADQRQSILAHSAEHLELMNRAAMLALWDPFAFVHAGIEPSQSLQHQTPRSCLWIRSPFLLHVGALEAIVVHGHSPQTPPRPHITENRISMDTGAFFSHVLTAAEIDRTSRTVRFVSPFKDGRIQPLDPVLLDRGQGCVLKRRADGGFDISRQLI